MRFLLRSILKQGRRPLLALLPALVLLGVFFFLPVCLVIYASFIEQPGKIAGLAAYWKLISDGYYLKVFLQTFIFALSLMIVTLLLAYPIAVFIARTHAWGRGVVSFLVISPLLVSMVVRAYGWQLILGNRGLVNSLLMNIGIEPIFFTSGWAAVVIASVHVLLPFAVISMAGVLSGLDRSIEESASVLGASPIRVLFFVTLPMAMNGILTAATFVFLLALGSFVTIMMLGGRNTMVVPLLIYQQINITYDQAFAAAMATVLAIVTLILLLSQFRLGKRGAIA